MRQRQTEEWKPVGAIANRPYRHYNYNDAEAR